MATKEIGIIGLGKMGANLARQLLSKGWQVHGFNRSPEITQKMKTEGLLKTSTLSELVEKLPVPRTLWLMVPHQSVESVLDELLPHLSEGDTVIDGGNSPYKQSIRLSAKLKEKRIHFLDVGVSGGPAGARYGALKKAPFSLNLQSISDLYNHGSVITSRLVGWLNEAFVKFGNELNNEECCSGQVAQSGEGLWTVEAAKELGIPVPIIEGSVKFRKQSQKNPSYTGQVLSALRHQFGGHDAAQQDEGEDHKHGKQ